MFRRRLSQTTLGEYLHKTERLVKKELNASFPLLINSTHLPTYMTLIDSYNLCVVVDILTYYFEKSRNSQGVESDNALFASIRAAVNVYTLMLPKSSLQDGLPVAVLAPKGTRAKFYGPDETLQQEKEKVGIELFGYYAVDYFDEDVQRWVLAKNYLQALECADSLKDQEWEVAFEGIATNRELGF